MAKSTSLNFTQNVKFAATTIEPADTSTLKTLFTAGTDDSVVKAIQVTNSDTAARIVGLYVNNGSTDFLIGHVNIPANSGVNGTAAAVDLLGGTLMPALPYDANGKRVLPMPAGFILKVNTTTTVAATRVVTVSCMAEDY
jgi:hypothetical protein